MAAQSERSEVRTCSMPGRPKVMAPKMMGRGVLDAMVIVSTS